MLAVQNDLKSSLERESQTNEKLAQTVTALDDQKLMNAQLQQDSRNFKLGTPSPCLIPNF